jgi:hypothetical protein
LWKIVLSFFSAKNRTFYSSLAITRCTSLKTRGHSRTRTNCINFFRDTRSKLTNIYILKLKLKWISAIYQFGVFWIFIILKIILWPLIRNLTILVRFYALNGIYCYVLRGVSCVKFFFVLFWHALCILMQISWITSFNNSKFFVNKKLFYEWNFLRD